MITYILIIIILILILFLLLYKKNNKLSFNEYFNNEKYTAIIIEPREHKALEFVLSNFLENLSDDWNFIIFHGNKNIDFINNLFDNQLKKYKYKVKLINLKIDNLTINDYNNLLVSKEFYNYIPTEIFLIFQTDTLICTDYKDSINDYIKYDYSGAPWKENEVGNGGLSLRRKSKMLEIINNCKYKNEPEDVYFSKACNNIKVNKPTIEDAKQFSVEAIYNNISFGVHKPWFFMNKNKLQTKNKFCNGLDKLIELNRK
jgi:hypothetical protein